MTHDLNCSELMDLAHLILYTIEKIQVPPEVTAQSVADLVKVVVHFWVFCLA